MGPNDQRRASGQPTQTEVMNELHNFTASMPKWMLDRVDAKAKRLGITRKALVNVIVSEWIRDGGAL